MYEAIKKETFIYQLLDQLTQQVMIYHKKQIYITDINPEIIAIDYNIFKD